MSVILKTHTLTQLSQDITNNTSQVRYLVQLQTTGGSFNDNNITTTYYIDGVRYTKTHKLPKTSTTTVVDRTVTITHNADGTRSVDASFSTPTQISAGTMTGSKSLTLSTIPRASSITVNDANIGSATNIVINKIPTNFTTTLWYKTDSDNDWIKIVDKTSNQVYGWTVPTSFYAKIPNNKTLYCEFKADTYNGDTYIGTTTTGATFTATGNPTIDIRTGTDINSITAQLTSGTNTSTTKMVKYASNIQVSVTATAQNSAYIKSITVNGNEVSLNGTSTSTTRSGTITFNNASTNSFSIVVKDSRENPTTQNISNTLTMVDYVPLTVNATIKRNQPTDGKVNINLSGNYFNGSFGNQNNTLTVQYRYKESTSSTWGNWTNLTPTISGNTYSGSTQLTNFEYDKSYNFEIRAIDKITTKPITGITVTKGTPVFWWDNDEFNVNGKFTTSDMATNNTTDTWVPVWNGGKLEHRVIPTAYNSTSPILETISANTIQNMNVASGTGSSQGIYVKLCNIKFSSHRQGEFVGMKIYIGRGNNGDSYQQAFIDLSMQLGWEGTKDGRLGCTWELHPMKTEFNLSNVNIIVIANSRINYDIYLWTSSTYCLPNYVVNCSQNVIVTAYKTTSSTAPSGTQCEIDKVLSLFVTETGSGIVNRSSGATLKSSTWRRYGNVVQLTIVIETTSSTSTGSNAFTGTINNSNLIPKIPINSSSYNGSTALNCYIDENGNISCRVLASNLSSGKEMTIGFTYVI